MFGKIDPKKMQQMMKQMGISQQEIDATRVIIEKEDGNIVIENPSVVKVNMSGQETFQISGDIKEEEIDSKIEEDLDAIISQTGVPKDVAAIELEKNNGDIAETIISLKKKS